MERGCIYAGAVALDPVSCFKKLIPELLKSREINIVNRLDLLIVK